MSKIKASLYALLAFFLWSLLGLVLNLSSFTAMQNISFQGFAGSVLASAILFKKRKSFPFTTIKKHSKLFFFMFFTNAAGVLFLYSYTIMPIAKVLFLFSSGPVIAVLIELLVLKQKPSTKKILAVALGLVGVSLILIENPFENASLITYGGILVLFASFLATVRDFIVKKMQERQLLEVIIFFILFSQLIFSLPFAMQSSWRFETYSVLASLAAGTLGGVIAFFLYYKAIHALKVSTVWVLYYSEILLGSLWGILFLSQAFSLQTLIGGAGILVAAYLALKSGE
ncbi:MAG: DMT family transporter [Candidatus Levybacteria bacterium]|nr:DMT family transporter [Candidatus Levybacteria bacterium]